MKELYLRVQRPFFNAIKKGTRTTEYREMSEYWVGKLLDTTRYKDKDLEEIKDEITKERATIKWAGHNVAVFSCEKDVVRKEIKDIKVYRGQDYFAIKLGKTIK